MPGAVCGNLQQRTCRQIKVRIIQFLNAYMPFRPIKIKDPIEIIRRTMKLMIFFAECKLHVTFKIIRLFEQRDKFPLAGL